MQTAPVYHPFHSVANAFGYTFSHSVTIRRRDGSAYLLACYKNGRNPAREAHNLSFQVLPATEWETSCGCATGRRWTGNGIESLKKHLRNKARRYYLPRF